MSEHVTCSKGEYSPAKPIQRHAHTVTCMYVCLLRKIHFSRGLLFNIFDKKRLSLLGSQCMPYLP